MYRTPCALFILLVLLSIPVASAAPDVTFTRNGTDLVGLCFGPYLNGEIAGETTLTEPVIRQRLMAVRSDTTWVRTFGVDHGLERVGPVAHELGMKVAVGAWLSNNTETDQIAVDRLIAIGKNGDADILVVGNEAMSKSKVPASTLISYMQEVRAEVPDIPVGTADIYGEIRDHPDVVSASDILLVNIYPYWEGVPVADAPEHTLESYDTITGIAGGRPVVISELGWPDAGNPYGGAVPSDGNAARYLHEVTAALHARSIPYFYFSAFDEAWKTDENGNENGVGPHWGIRNGDLSLKPGRLPLPRFDSTGVFRAGQWILDYGIDGTVNRRFTYGLATDKPVVGDFNNDGTTDIGVFRSGQWILDYGMDGTVNRRFNFGLATDIPIVGDFNNDGTIDTGVFRSGQWILDYGMDGTVNRRFTYGMATDMPIVGDFNNDGTTDIGVFRAGQWILDYGMDRTVDRRFTYGLATDIPVVGDFNNNGTADIGVFRAGQWILDYSMDRTVDRRLTYGMATDTPLVGKWA